MSEKQEPKIGMRVIATINAEIVAISSDGEWVQLSYAGHKFWVPLDEFVRPSQTELK